MSVCTLCKSSLQDALRYGEFLSNRKMSVHTFCLYLSSNLSQRGEDTEGFLGFLLTDIIKEEQRIKSLKCYYCGKVYANIGCCERKCHRSFHLICGLNNGAQFQFIKSFNSFCSRHVRKIGFSPSIEEMCCICFEKLQAPGEKFSPVNMLRSPCCRNGWYHKRCLQKFANTAGYFFKCPLCNDTEKFRFKVRYQGIFIPDKDAAWELESNAYEELLERPDVCSAKVCYSSTRRSLRDLNPLIYCSTCGSIAIHQKCLSSGCSSFNCCDCKKFMGMDSDNESQEKSNDVDYIEVDVCNDDSEDSTAENNVYKISNDKKFQLKGQLRHIDLLEDDENECTDPVKLSTTQEILDTDTENGDEIYTINLCSPAYHAKDNSLKDKDDGISRENINDRFIKQRISNTLIKDEDIIEKAVVQDEKKNDDGDFFKNVANGCLKQEECDLNKNCARLLRRANYRIPGSSDEDSSSDWPLVKVKGYIGNTSEEKRLTSSTANVTVESKVTKSANFLGPLQMSKEANTSAENSYSVEAAQCHAMRSAEKCTRTDKYAPCIAECTRRTCIEGSITSHDTHNKDDPDDTDSASSYATALQSDNELCGLALNISSIENHCSPHKSLCQAATSLQQLYEANRKSPSSKKYSELFVNTAPYLPERKALPRTATLPPILTVKSEQWLHNSTDMNECEYASSTAASTGNLLCCNPIFRFKYNSGVTPTSSSENNTPSNIKLEEEAEEQPHTSRSVQIVAGKFISNYGTKKMETPSFKKYSKLRRIHHETVKKTAMITVDKEDPLDNFEHFCLKKECGNINERNCNLSRRVVNLISDSTHDDFTESVCINREREMLDMKSDKAVKSRIRGSADSQVHLLVSSKAERNDEKETNLIVENPYSTVAASSVSMQSAETVSTSTDVDVGLTTLNQSCIAKRTRRKSVYIERLNTPVNDKTDTLSINTTSTQSDHEPPINLNISCHVNPIRQRNFSRPIVAHWLQLDGEAEEESSTVDNSLIFTSNVEPKALLNRAAPQCSFSNKLEEQAKEQPHASGSARFAADKFINNYGTYKMETPFFKKYSKLPRIHHKTVKKAAMITVDKEDPLENFEHFCFKKERGNINERNSNLSRRVVNLISDSTYDGFTGSVCTNREREMLDMKSDKADKSRVRGSADSQVHLLVSSKAERNDEKETNLIVENSYSTVAASSASIQSAETCTLTDVDVGLTTLNRSCIAKRTRRKSVYIERTNGERDDDETDSLSSYTTSTQSDNEPANNLNISYIANRTRRRSSLRSVATSLQQLDKEVVEGSSKSETSLISPSNRGSKILLNKATSLRASLSNKQEERAEQPHTSSSARIVAGKCINYFNMEIGETLSFENDGKHHRINQKLDIYNDGFGSSSENFCFQKGENVPKNIYYSKLRRRVVDRSSDNTDDHSKESKKSDVKSENAVESNTGKSADALVHFDAKETNGCTENLYSSIAASSVSMRSADKCRSTDVAVDLTTLNESCIAKRTRRKSVYIERSNVERNDDEIDTLSSYTTSTQSDNEPANNFDISCIANRTRRRSSLRAVTTSLQTFDEETEDEISSSGKYSELPSNTNICRSKSKLLLKRATSRAISPSILAAKRARHRLRNCDYDSGNENKTSNQNIIKNGIPPRCHSSYPYNVDPYIEPRYVRSNGKLRKVSLCKRSLYRSNFEERYTFLVGSMDKSHHRL